MPFPSDARLLLVPVADALGVPVDSLDLPEEPPAEFSSIVATARIDVAPVLHATITTDSAVRHWVVRGGAAVHLQPAEVLGRLARNATELWALRLRLDDHPAAGAVEAAFDEMNSGFEDIPPA